MALTTIRLGVTSRGLAPKTGVAGALPLLQAFSYEVSEKKFFISHEFFNIKKTIFKKRQKGGNGRKNNKKNKYKNLKSLYMNPANGFNFKVCHLFFFYV